MLALQSALGITAFVAIAWLLSRDRAAVRWRLVGIALVLHFCLAMLLLRVPWIGEALLLLNHVVSAVESATNAGSSFVFGYLGGGAAPFSTSNPGNLYLFAFRVLPQILVFSVLVALFWHWRILPLLVRLIGKALQKVLGLGGAVGMAAGASVFLGMAEMPLVIRAYLHQLSRGELFMIMTCGMSTVAGSIMVLYASVLTPVLPGALGHILVASFLNIVAAIYVAHLLMPQAEDTGTSTVTDSLQYASSMDAINRGTADGLRLAANVGAMVLVFVALVALVNQILAPIVVDDAPMSLQRGLGWLFAPVAWLMGVEWVEAQAAGALLGTKVVINELVAYLDMAALPAGTLSERASLIMTYGLCGFANLGSLGILLAGLTTLVPERREEVLAIGPWTLVSGTLATCLTGAQVALATSF